MKKVLKNRDMFKMAALRGEFSLRTRSESLDEKNFKYNRKIKHKNRLLDY